MWITLPASAAGGSAPASVLDLEPLLVFARHCRPDAVALMPPIGADDQPNGPALLAMKGRLEKEGLRVVAGRLELPGDALVADAAFRAQTLFEARALLVALGEAGLGPLTVDWQSSPGAPREMLEFLGELVEEAERVRVPLAVGASLPLEALAGALRTLRSPYLGLCWNVNAERLAPEALQPLTARPGRLLVAVWAPSDPDAGMPGPADSEALVAALTVLRETGFTGPLLLEGLWGPLDYAHTAGFARGVVVGCRV